MRATNWTARTDSQTVASRAAGRRRYNFWRNLCSQARLGAVARELKDVGFLLGNQAEIARRLGVHRSTIHRDLKKIEMGLRGYTVEEIDMVSKSWHHSEASIILRKERSQRDASLG